MKIQPLRDRVLVKRVEAEDKTPGGIVIPGGVKEKPVQGHVISTGDGWADASGWNEHIIKPGDRVLFLKHAGVEVVIDGVEHLIMGQSEILAIVE